jgi:hypothetical protein
VGVNHLLDCYCLLLSELTEKTVDVLRFGEADFLISRMARVQVFMILMVLLNAFTNAQLRTHGIYNFRLHDIS